MSNPVTSPRCRDRNSHNSRATTVLPTIGRGEETMETGVRFIRAISGARCAVAKQKPGCSRLFFAQSRAGPVADQIGELDAIELAPDIGQPVPHIAAQHERVVLGLVVDALVG